MESLKHLMILCCYGGVPFIDYGDHDIKHQSTNILDPTDWIAVDSSGSLLNATIHPDLLTSNLTQLIPDDFAIPLDHCDLYNLTFSSLSDQNIFEGHGLLSCRCPRTRFGSSCHLKNPPGFSPDSVANVAAAFLQMDSNDGPADGHSTPFNMVIISFFCLLILMSALFMMMRGCFCDCFGGLKNPFSTTEHREPLNPDAINRCLEAVRTHEQNEKNRYGMESRHPLIPSISEGCSPYDTTVLPRGCYEVVPPPPQRNCSPPPSYRSKHGSMEYLPGNTKL